MPSLKHTSQRPSKVRPVIVQPANNSTDVILVFTDVYRIYSVCIYIYYTHGEELEIF